MKRGLIFDLDGTLWDSSGVIRPLWNEILAAHGREPLDEAAFGGLMGLTKAEIAARLFPTKPEEERLAVMDECFFAEQKLLRRVGARLYPGLRETLEALRGAYGLYIVSNCAPAYLEAFFEAHGLRELFDDWETHGGTGLPKSGNIRLLCERNALSRAWYIGDAASDAAAAREAELPVIHAAYGFGELPEAELRVRRIDELPALLASLERRTDP